MTRDELLEKGLSPEIADEVIAAFNGDDTEDDALLALQKALDGDSVKTGSLFKADDGDDEEPDNDDEDEDDENEDDEDEKDMKKKMKKYMKDNPEMCKKFMKELGGFEDKMEKAADELALSQDDIVELADITPYLDNQREFNVTMLKAFETLSKAVAVIAEKSEESYDLMQKAARVTLEQSKLLAADAATPVGRKGAITSDMQKAQVSPFAVNDGKAVYEVLMKAVKDRVEGAGEVMSVFESHGKNINALNGEARKFVATLLEKEGK